MTEKSATPPAVWEISFLGVRARTDNEALVNAANDGDVMARSRLVGLLGEMIPNTHRQASAFDKGLTIEKIV